MAQLERGRRSTDTSKSPTAQTSPTFEQLLHGETPTWLSSNSPTFGKNHDQEEEHSGHNKKSVLTKVKERAKKLRHSLSGKKKHGLESHDDNITSPWSGSLNKDDEDDDEDPEYLGAPMYESELAPEKYKETARQHPRDIHVDSQNHVLLSNDRQGKEDQLPSPDKARTEGVYGKLTPTYSKAQKGENEHLPSPNKATTKSVSEKVSPTYAKAQQKKQEQLPSPNKPIYNTVPDKLAPTYDKTQQGKEDHLPNSNKTITKSVSEKLATTHAKGQQRKEEKLPRPIKTMNGTVSDKLEPPHAEAQQRKQEQLVNPNKTTPMYARTEHGKEEKLPSPNKTITETMSEKFAPTYAAVSDATHTIASKIASLTVATADYASSTIASPRTAGVDRSMGNTGHGTSSPHKWDRGVSVKEYLMQKLEPGEDERALSQAISDAISPKRNPDDIGVVEKMKGAVTSFLRTDQIFSPSTNKTTNSSLNIPISANQSSLPHIPISATNTNSSSHISHIPISTTINTNSFSQISHQPTSTTTNRNSSSYISDKPILTTSATSQSSIPISTNAHEVVEEQNFGRILQTN